MNPILHLPQACTFQFARDCNTITDEQVANIIRCIINDDAPKKFRVNYNSGVRGDPGDEWLEIEADQYRLAFFVRNHSITNCFMAMTPKGSRYNINKEGGNVGNHLTIEESRTLTTKLLVLADKKVKVELIPCWIVAIGGARPYSAYLHYSKDAGEKARIEQEAHYRKYSKQDEDTDNGGAGVGFRTNDKVGPTGDDSESKIDKHNKRQRNLK